MTKTFDNTSCLRRKPINPMEIVIVADTDVRQLVPIPVARKSTHYTFEVVGVKEGIWP